MEELFFSISENDSEKLKKSWNIFNGKEQIGTISGFHRNSRGNFCHFCIAELNLYSEINAKIFDKILKFVSENFYREFLSAAIAIKNKNFQKFSREFSQNGFSLQSAHLPNFQEFFVKHAVKNQFTIIPLRKNILHITDGTSTFSTVVLGKKSALVVDTLWGTTDYKGLLKKIIPIPYKIVNTHGHPDHSFGNFQFDEVFMNEKDFKVFHEKTIYNYERDEKFFNDEDRIKFGSFTEKIPSKLPENAFFDLGGITIQSVNLSGHTTGSTGFLVNEEKILISGDAISEELWLFMEESSTPAETLEIYRKALSLDFDYIISSHSKSLHDRKLLEIIIKNLKNIVSNNFTAENPVQILNYSTSAVKYTESELTSSILIPANLQN